VPAAPAADGSLRFERAVEPAPAPVLPAGA
jgi:hypothetical protein